MAHPATTDSMERNGTLSATFSQWKRDAFDCHKVVARKFCSILLDPGRRIRLIALVAFCHSAGNFLPTIYMAQGETKFLCALYPWLGNFYFSI